MTDISAQPGNARWVLAIAGRDEQVSVEAATITQHRAAGSDEVILTTLHDADGEIVFQAPALSVAYVRRCGPPNHVIPRPAP